MKKALSILLLAVLCLSLFSCHITPEDADNELSEEAYFAQPFSTPFYGYGSLYQHKIDITAEHSVFPKDAIELTLYFAIARSEDDELLSKFEKYKIEVTTAETFFDRNDKNIYTFPEQTTDGYDDDEFLGVYEIGPGDVIRDESAWPVPDPCKYNHSEKIIVPSEIIETETGCFYFKVYLKFKDNADYASNYIASNLCRVYYKVVGDKVFISSLPNQLY